MHIPDRSAVYIRTLPKALRDVLKDIVYKLETTDELPVHHCVSILYTQEISAILCNKGYRVYKIRQDDARMTHTLEIC